MTYDNTNEPLSIYYDVNLRKEAHRICKLINKHLSCDFDNYTPDQYPNVRHDWSCDSTCDWLLEIDKAPSIYI